MIKREFYRFEGSITVSFSHGDFGFVVQTFNDAAGECLLSATAVEQELATAAPSNETRDLLRVIRRWILHSRNNAIFRCFF